MKTITPPTTQELERYAEIMRLHEIDGARDRLFYEGFNSDEVTMEVLDELATDFEQKRSIYKADAEVWSEVIQNYHQNVQSFSLAPATPTCNGE